MNDALLSLFIVLIAVGNVVVDLDVSKAAKESQNFIKLCKAKYYNFSPFYNIQSGFIAECGAPLYPISKEGQSAWNLADSCVSKDFKVPSNQLNPNKRGSLSYITNSINNDKYASSIFTITLADIDSSIKTLSNNVVFGHVSEGLEILEKLNNSIVDRNHRPLQDIRIHHTYILDDPFDDIEGLVIPENSPELTPKQLSTIRLNDIEDLNLNEDNVDEDELKRKQQRDADSKAITLELIGDLPSAEVKPMENVLFVCKLNPITKDDDLKIIFSRFGKIISCDIIRDNKTGDSLQYAFIEFDNKKSCENAYFKMDQVLIDDRRVHVDFSQSVSKLSEAWRRKTNEKRSNKKMKF